MWRRSLYGAIGARGAAAFSPLDLSPTAWYDPSDLSTLFQDSAGTTPVTADGDVVGLMQDKSGNDIHWSQATTANKPLYKTAAGLHWLQFDGVDDGGVSSALTAFADATFVTGVLTSDTTFVTMSKATAAEPYIGVVQQGNASAADINTGTPTYWANGTQISPQTRGDLYTAVSTGAGRVFEIRTVDLTAAAFTTINFGNYATFEFAGNLYGLVLATEANMNTNRAAIQQYMATKAGTSF